MPPAACRPEKPGTREWRGLRVLGVNARAKRRTLPIAFREPPHSGLHGGGRPGWSACRACLARSGAALRLRLNLRLNLDTGRADT